MVGFYLAFSLLPLLGFNETEVVRLMSFQELKQTPPLPIEVTGADLPVVASGVPEAESWLKSHVLGRSPSTKISGIVVGRGMLCNEDFEHAWSSVLPCVRNLRHILSEWGMAEDVELSVAFSSDCVEEVNPTGSKLKENSSTLEPLMRYVKDSNLSYTIEQTKYAFASHSSHISYYRLPDKLAEEKGAKLRKLLAIA